MSCFGVEIRDIIIVILTILIAYLFYKTRKVEGFADPTPAQLKDMVKKAVEDTYLVDISAMRNLANISQNIMADSDKLTLPSNITIPGDLTVEGNVYYTNRNTNLMSLFPKFMIIAWASADGVPKGWAMCDGQKYKMDPVTGVVTPLNANATDADMVITPDLKGRFILGAGTGTGLTNREYNKTGGEERVTLKAEHMPSHSHDLSEFTNRIGCEGTDCHSPDTNSWYSFGGGSGNKVHKWPHAKPGNLTVNTGGAGGDQSHNNIPPFYVLIYIMKL
jgi:microcystin-dependent protein